MADLIPLSAVSAGGPQQAAPQQTPPDLIPLDQVKVTAPQEAPAVQDSTFQDQFKRALSFGLSDKIGAAVAAQGPAIRAGIGALKSGTTADASVAPQMPQNRMVTLADMQAAPGPSYAPVTQDVAAPDTGTSVSDAYHARLNQLRASSDAYAQDHPVLSKVATTLGTVASIPLIAGGTAAVAPTLGGRMLQGAKVGAGVGAAAGFGGSNDESLLQTATDTAVGSGIGAAAGAAGPVLAEHVVQPIWNWVARRFSPAAADNQAVQRIVQRIGQGGPSAQDMLDLVNAAAPNKPITLADLGGGNVLGEAGRVARAPGPGKQTAIDTLNSRDAGAGARLIGDVNAGLAPGGQSAFETGAALNQARRVAAGPAYAQAYAAPPLNPDTIAAGGQLDQLMSRPSMVQAARNALATAAEEGRDPASLGITFDASGSPKFERVPSWQTLDYIKGGLTDVVEKSRDPVTGRLVLDRQGNATNGTLHDFTDFLDQNNPDYAAARAAWSGPSQSLGALNQGRTVFNRSPEQIQADLHGMAPGDQEFYRLGAADALRTRIAQTSSGGDEARKIIGSQYTQQQLRPLFATQDAYDRFIASATTEHRMFDTRLQTIGNSATAGRVAEDDGSRAGGGAIGGAVEAGAGLLAGEHVAPLAGGLRILRSLSSNRPPSDPGVNAAISRMLFNTDQGANRELLARIIAGQNAPTMLPSATVPLASLASQAAPPLLRGYQGHQP